jgi:hypothetical protein
MGNSELGAATLVGASEEAADVAAKCLAERGFRAFGMINFDRKGSNVETNVDITSKGDGECKGPSKW